MILLVLLLAVIFVVLGMKVHDLTLRLSKFEDRFLHLTRRLSEMERKLNEFQRKPAPQPESAAAAATAAAVATTAAIEEPSPLAPQPAPQMPIPVAPVRQPEPSKIVPPAPAIPVQAPPVQEAKAEPSFIPHKPAEPRTPIIPAVSWKLPKFDWENFVGVKLFSWIAGVALLLAAVFFLRYSINRGWLMPPVRMTIGILLGIGLLILCELKAARKYPVTANAMDASAIAILFSTFFAARALWNLIGAIPAFALMILVTVVAVLLSIRRNSMFIALLGLVGGFATPALLSSGENRPISLFVYILVLNAGLAWVAARKKWPVLTTLSLVFTVVYQWGWVMKYLSQEQMPIALGIFLAFPILAFAGAALGKTEPSTGWISLRGQTANITAALPLLFALYSAAIPAYGQRYWLLFGFLFLIDAGLLAIATARGQEIMHAIGGLATLLTFVFWMKSSYASSAWPEILGILAAFVFFYLAAPFIARRFGCNFQEIGQKTVYAAPLLLFAFPCLVFMEAACASPGLLLGTLLLILLATATCALISEEGGIYFIAAAFALLTEALWSANYLSPERLISGLVFYASMSLLFIGVPIAAQRLGKKLHPQAATPGLLLASIMLLFFLAAGSISEASIWGIALLLLVLNAALFWQGALLRRWGLALVGMVISWIVLAALWMSAPLSAILIPALTVMAGFALLVLCGNIWMQRKAEGADSQLAGVGIYLGLAGHLFLIAIAAQKSLSVPPWPFLGILLLLTLAIGYAAIYTRKSNLHLSSMAATALLLAIWVAAAQTSPWPATAIYASAVLAMIGFAWIYLAKRTGLDPTPFSRTAAITVVLAQGIAIVAAGQSGSPGVGFLLAIHLILLIALLGLEWARKTYVFAVVAVLSTAAATSIWAVQHPDPHFWPQLLLFATPIYLVFIGYPLLLGKRCGRASAPHLAAVLAGIPFFFLARHAILQAGWGYAIGLLPTIQAFLMVLLLMRLLKAEMPGARSLGRLALVAGAGLAFITVAIPLQLEKEWITIGWALEGAALAWLYGKIPHKGLLLAASGLLTTVFVRLSMNPFILHYQPRSEVRIWNWYLYTYLVAAAALILGGWLLSRTKDALVDNWLRMSRLFTAGGVLLLFLLLNIEIADFYSTGTTITFRFTATLAQDLTYTLGWALFAVVLLAVGIAIKNQPARIASLALLVVTILKCFIHDLARLGGLYLVASFVGLAICLALVALALQKFVLSARKEAK